MSYRRSSIKNHIKSNYDIEDNCSYQQNLPIIHELCRFSVVPQSRSAVFPNDKDSKKKVRPIAATNNTSNPVCASSDGIIIV